VHEEPQQVGAMSVFRKGRFYGSERQSESANMTPIRIGAALLLPVMLLQLCGFGQHCEQGSLAELRELRSIVSTDLDALLIRDLSDNTECASGGTRTSPALWILRLTAQRSKSHFGMPPGRPATRSSRWPAVEAHSFGFVKPVESVDAAAVITPEAGEYTVEVFFWD
jgi:hypothetical protein